jgi:hypothetical protein
MEFLLILDLFKHYVVAQHAKPYIEIILNRVRFKFTSKNFEFSYNQ